MTAAGTGLVHYHAPQTRSFTIQWLLEELGVERETRVLNLKKGEHKEPSYLAINPMGKVPAITHHGVPVTETVAIALYLADAFPHAGLAPAIGEADRAPYLRWLVFYAAAVEPAILDRALQREAGSPSMLPYGSSQTTIDVFAAALRKGPYLLGERFSAADVVLGSAVRWMLQFKLLPEAAEFTAYAKAVSARPACQRAVALDTRLYEALNVA